jgi:glutamine amidotransferase
MIVVVDCGIGNLRSAQRGLQRAGCEAIISERPEDIAAAEAVVLPGQGAFADCYYGLTDRGLAGPVREAALEGKPFLGICVGMQLLFEGSEEGEGAPGLGVFKGRVVRFSKALDPALKVPHMGWNELVRHDKGDCPLLRDLPERPFMYFAHSYYARPDDPDVVIASSHHGVEFPAIVGRDNIFAVQFHPEKSQEHGIAILRQFAELVRAVR